MSLWRATKKTASHLVNIRADQWMDLEGLKTSIHKTFSLAKDLAYPTTHHYNETFEEALYRLGISKEKLAQKITIFTRLFFIYLILSVSVFLYSISILVLHHNYFGFAMGLALTLYTFTRTFYYHFWLFQIQQKKLGCSLGEWWNASSNHSLTRKK